MKALRSLPRRIVPMAAIALAALAMVGCSKKITAVDPAYTAPEGTYSQDARLIVYPDLPITVDTFTDYLPPGPGTEDVLERTDQVTVSPGTLHGLIFDGTSAGGYEVLRRESGGGYAQLKDYVLGPAVRFIDSHWEAYRFDDISPSSFTPPSYLGRGLLSGVVTASSPLTNASELTTTSVLPLTYTGEPFPRDSNITMSWQPVTGATGYWIQIYQYGGSSLDQLYAAAPAPFLATNVTNSFVGYVAAPATSYKLGEPGALVLMRKTLLTSIEYLVRITAVNDQGEMLAFSYGDWQYIMGAGFYYRYRVGAAKVMPMR